MQRQSVAPQEGIAKLRRELDDHVKKGLIRKQRRRSHENYELVPSDRQSEDALERIARLSRGGRVDKVVMGLDYASSHTESYPYFLEDFGGLLLQEYATKA